MAKPASAIRADLIFFNHNGARLLAAITITGDAVCRSTNVTYRLDTGSSRNFLALT
jgi:hypothetical protein